MPNDLSVQSVGAPGQGSASPSASGTTAPTFPTVPAASAMLPNPTVRLDSALGLVVIEFRDAVGTVTNSIPTQQQLEAYRAWERDRLGASDTSIANLVAGAGVVSAPTIGPTTASAADATATRDDAASAVTPTAVTPAAAPVGATSDSSRAHTGGSGSDTGKPG
jgi:hypothetical protein